MKTSEKSKKSTESLQKAMEFVKRTQEKNEELKRQFSEKDETILLAGDQNKKLNKKHQEAIKKLKNDYIKEQNRLSADKDDFAEQIKQKEQEVARLEKQVDSQSKVRDEDLNKLQGKVDHLDLQNEKLKKDNEKIQEVLQKSTSEKRDASIQHKKEVEQLKSEQKK